MESVDSLITPMELTDDIMNTHLYDKKLMVIRH